MKKRKIRDIFIPFLQGICFACFAQCPPTEGDHNEIKPPQPALKQLDNAIVLSEHSFASKESSF